MTIKTKPSQNQNQTGLGGPFQLGQSQCIYRTHPVSNRSANSKTKSAQDQILIKMQNLINEITNQTILHYISSDNQLLLFAHILSLSGCSIRQWLFASDAEKDKLRRTIHPKIIEYLFHEELLQDLKNGTPEDIVMLKKLSQRNT